MPQRTNLPSPFMTLAIAQAAARLQVVKRVPLVKLVLLAEVAILAKAHYERLTPSERRRLVILVRDARGLPRNLNERDRRELTKLVAKAEPKAFAAQAVQKFSPVGPRR